MQAVIEIDRVLITDHSAYCGKLVFMLWVSFCGNMISITYHFKRLYELKIIKPNENAIVGRNIAKKFYPNI